MKIVIYILLALFCIFLILICLLWAMYHASGHIIPYETDLGFVCLTLLNFVVISILIIVLKKTSKNK